MENCELHFTEKAIEVDRSPSTRQSVGARGLRGIVEKVMLDIMFDLPDQAEGTGFNIDLDEADGKLKPFKLTATEKKSAKLFVVTLTSLLSERRLLALTASLAVIQCRGSLRDPTH